MMEQNPWLKKHITYSRSQRRMTFNPLGSFYQVLSADSGNKDGLNSHGVIFDELHAQRDRDFFDVMTTSSGLTREQPLQFIITTAGFSRHSIGWRQHQYAESVLRGDVVDPHFYPVIFNAPEDADWQSEEVWRRANPSYGITIIPSVFLMEFEKAKFDWADENQFRRQNLNQWLKQYTRWMPMDKWDACGDSIALDALEGRACYGGLDLSSNDDLTAFVLVFPPEDEDDKYFILPHFWIPEEAIERRVKKDHVPYDDWAKRKFLHTTDGEVVDYDFVREKIKVLAKKYAIQEIGYDAWGANLLSQQLKKEGLKVTGIVQSFGNLSYPSKALLTLVKKRRIAHGGHPVLRWNFDTVMMKIDENANIKPDKKKSTEKIDGVLASVMALGLAMAHEPKKSGGILVYDKATDTFTRNGVVLDVPKRGQ
jgi:phage terminase large subunit-like protein